MKIYQKIFATASFVSLIMTATALVSNAQIGTTITLDPNSATIYVGESKTANISGVAPYSISNNSNPSVASAVITGSTLVVNGYTDGTDSLSVCSYVNNGVSCGNFNITVLKRADTQQTSQQTATISFSQNQVTLNVGQTQTVTATGSGPGTYYISGYGSDSVNASINNNVVTLTGNKVGGSNITVCQFGGGCGNVYGFVPVSDSNSTAQAAQTSQSVTPALSAFYMASNNAGGTFLGKGAILTLKFNTSADIVSNVFRINELQVPMTGVGSGPYGGTYIMTGNEPIPLPISIDFGTAQGLSGHTSFTIGDKANVPPKIAEPVLSSPLLASESSKSGKFSRLLQNGSSGADVTALQTLLKKLGVYSGPVTGSFGAQTEAAVKKYQAKNKLKQAGVLGPATRELLNKEK